MDVAAYDRRAQALESLSKANNFRLVVAAEKRKIAQMPMSEACGYLSDLIETTEDPAMLSAQVRFLLGALPRKGPRFVERAFNDLGIRSTTRRLRDLTERQRLVMADYVRDLV